MDVCSYCGCEAEPVVRDLMADHAVIAALAYRIRASVTGAGAEAVGPLLAELAAAFTEHSLGEDAGLFTQLRLAGEALGEVGELEAQHRRLRPALADLSLPERPGELLALLDELAEHAEREDNDLFPFAFQCLPNSCWSALAAL